MEQAPGLVSSTLGVKAATASDNRLEAARVPPGFVGHHDEIRATCLGLPAALAETNPFGPGWSRGRDHPVRGDDRSRPVCEPGGDKRPIRAPDDKGANRGHVELTPEAAAHSVSAGWLHHDRRLLPRVCKDLSRPWPSPSPDQLDSLTVQRRSEGPGQRATTRRALGLSPQMIPLATPVGQAASSTTKVEPRSRARAESRLASVGRTGTSGARQTRSTVSSKVETTLCQRPSAPGSGNEDETVQIGSQLGRRGKTELRQADDRAPVTHRAMCLRAARATGSSIPAPGPAWPS